MTARFDRVGDKQLSALAWVSDVPDVSMTHRRDQLEMFLQDSFNHKRFSIVVLLREILVETEEKKSFSGEAIRYQLLYLESNRLISCDNP